MPDITSKTPVQEATVQRMRVAIHTPYTEGHSITVNEASVLNQTRIENVRNNCANAVDELVTKAGGADKVDLKAVQKLVLEYSLEYVFGERKGGGFRTADPIEAEAMNIARGLVRDAILAKGLRLKDVAAAKITELARKAVDSKPEITKRATRLVESRREAAKDLTIELPD